MGESIYKVTAKDGQLLIETNSLEMIYAFIKGYRLLYFNETLNLTISEHRVEAVESCDYTKHKK